MPPQLYFFVSIAFAFVAWGIVATRYIWPKLRGLPRAEALRPILILHSFRFVGLAFVVTGVVSPDLPTAFANPAAYGDIAAATLALLALATLQSRVGVAIAWIFNLWGSFDLLSAFYHGGTTGLMPGQLGAAYVVQHPEDGCGDGLRASDDLDGAQFAEPFPAGVAAHGRDDMCAGVGGELHREASDTA